MTNESEMQQRDEISLFDRWEKLRYSWKVFVAGWCSGLLERWRWFRFV